MTGFKSVFMGLLHWLDAGADESGKSCLPYRESFCKVIILTKLSASRISDIHQTTSQCVPKNGALYATHNQHVTAFVTKVLLEILNSILAWSHYHNYCDL